MRKIAHNRTSNTYSRNNSCSQYSTLRYFFCTSTDAYFKKKEKYEIHSKDLVNTLNKWIDSIGFPNYEYVGGSLSVCDYKSNDEIPLLTQAKKHLEKSYPRILNMHNDTIQECTQLCRKIKEIINAQDKPSFESIITAEINTACPKLKMTYDTNLRESNIYIAPYVFKTIFKNQPINANEFDASGQKLVYGGITTFAQGEKPDMEKLKQVLLELISNNEIKKFIEEYHTLHKELENKSASFKRELRDLYYSVKGGMTLDKPKDCEICKSF